MVDEVSGAGEPSLRARVLVVLVVVLVLLGLGADRWAAQRERRALLDAVGSGEHVVDRSSQRLLGLRTYVGPLVGDPDARPAARQWAVDTLRGEAADWRPRVQDQRAAVLDVPVLRWHGDLVAARDAYAERLAAWDEVLAGVGRRGGTSGTDTRAGAAEALVAAGLDPGDVRSLLPGGLSG